MDVTVGRTACSVRNMGYGVAGVGRRQRGSPVRVTAVGIADEIVDFLSHFVDDLGDLFHQLV